MGSSFDDFAAVEGDDAVDGARGAEAVGDEDDGAAAAAEGADAFVDGFFGQGVEGGGGFEPMKPAPPVTRINMPPTVEARDRWWTSRREDVKGS
ncbi:hypothetical protein ABZ547_24880 [Streptomyces sparsogenes]|uniref:hypothetical protein n=1 Tax=Streptomyces sparsogenes TaxID=67365 RepID=UPI0033C4BCFB